MKIEMETITLNEIKLEQIKCKLNDELFCAVAKRCLHYLAYKGNWRMTPHAHVLKELKKEASR